MGVWFQPDRPDELQRIEAAGGRVIDWDGPRVNAILAMSRAIGELLVSSCANFYYEFCPFYNLSNISN